MQMLLVFGCMLTAGLMPASYAEAALDDESVFLQLPENSKTFRVKATPHTQLPSMRQTQLVQERSKSSTLHQTKHAQGRARSAMRLPMRLHAKPKAPVHPVEKNVNLDTSKRKRILPQRLGMRPHGQVSLMQDISVLKHGLHEAVKNMVKSEMTNLKARFKARHAEDPDFTSETIDPDAKWPAPDDPSLEITDTDRQRVQAFKDAMAENNGTKINASVGHLALIPPQLQHEEGVYPLVFKAIRDYQGDEWATLQQNAWRGLSDQCMTEIGHREIPHIGGPNKGLEYMIEQALVHPFHYGTLTDHLDVQYEIMMDIQGLLLLDNNRTLGPAAIEAGLVPAVMRTLMGEPDSIAAQATACKVMFNLFVRNPEYAKNFREAGAYNYILDAMDRFQDGDDTPFHFGLTMGMNYNVTSSCFFPASMLYLDDLKRQYLDETIKTWKPWLEVKL